MLAFAGDYEEQNEQMMRVLMGPLEMVWSR
jgi:hypothetical protein